MVLAKVLAPAKIIARIFAVALCEVREIEHGIPDLLLFDCVIQFAFKLLQSVCRMLGTIKVYESTYYRNRLSWLGGRVLCSPQCQINYVNNLLNEADEFATAIMCACSFQMPQSTTTKPLRLILSRRPLDFTRHHEMIYERPWIRQSLVFFLATITSYSRKALDPLWHIQAQHKSDFDRRVKKKATDKQLDLNKLL